MFINAITYVRLQAEYYRWLVRNGLQAEAWRHRLAMLRYIGQDDFTVIQRDLLRHFWSASA